MRPGSRRTPSGRVSNSWAKDCDGGLDHKRGMFEPLLVKLGEDLGDMALAPNLIIAVVALGEEEAADAQEELDGGAIDERAGEGLEIPDDCHFTELLRLSHNSCDGFAELLRPGRAAEEGGGGLEVSEHGACFFDFVRNQAQQLFGTSEER